jgi:aryl sulfotransferase
LPHDFPRVTREYKNHHLDSTRWRVFEPRDDDIIVTTSYKSGTTWMQQILRLLILRDDPSAPYAREASPWFDARFHAPIEELAAAIEAQTHRRFIKSHLPFDGLPYYPQAKYVVVGRDTRDVFMSLWNHYGNYTDMVMQRLNDMDGWSGDPLPDPPTEIRPFWRSWMTRGWFDWESEGWPFWSNLHHTQTYWDYKHLPNMLLVHYSDMLADLPGQVQRVADFLDIEISAAELDAVVKGSSFDEMKTQAQDVDDMMKVAFKDGVDTFFFKGTNGRWRDVLTDEDLELYEQAKQRVLTPDCAEWLECGSLGSR